MEQRVDELIQMARASANLALRKDDFSVDKEGAAPRREGLPSLPSIVDTFNGLWFVCCVLGDV